MTSPALSQAHPSYLLLDRASLGLVQPAVEAHLQTCAECRAYLATLQQTPSPDFQVLRARIARQSKVRAWPWAWAVPLAAAACLLLVFVRPLSKPANTVEGYVGAKGFLSVWIYVKHGNETKLWDGSHQLVPGDRLRLKIDPGRYRHVEVYSLKERRQPELLYAGGVSQAGVTLPEAWEVDAEPGAEELAVVFSQAPTKPVWPDWLEGRAPADVSVHDFVLPKSTAGVVDSGAKEP